MTNLYEAMIGNAPAQGSPEQAMLAKALQQKQTMGLLGQMTGDKVIAPTGMSMQTQVKDTAAGLRRTRQLELERSQRKGFHVEEMGQMDANRDQNQSQFDDTKEFDAESRRLQNLNKKLDRLQGRWTTLQGVRQEIKNRNEGGRKHDTGLVEDARQHDTGLEEGARQHDTGLVESARQHDTGLVEGARRFDTTHEEGVRQFDTSHEEGVRRYDTDYDQRERFQKDVLGESAADRDQRWDIHEGGREEQAADRTFRGEQGGLNRAMQREEGADNRGLTRSMGIMRDNTARRGQDITKRGQDLGFEADIYRTDGSVTAAGAQLRVKLAKQFDDKVVKFGEKMESTGTAAMGQSVKMADEALAPFIGKDGKLLKNIPGSGGFMNISWLGTMFGDASGRQVKMTLQDLKNTIIKDTSGAAVSGQEFVRLQQQLGDTVWHNDEDAAYAFSLIKKAYGAKLKHMQGTYGLGVLEAYSRNGGDFYGLEHMIAPQDQGTDLDVELQGEELALWNEMGGGR